MARRRLATITFATMLLAAGCTPALPPSLDGDLGNNWAAVAAPEPYQPKVGTCLHVSGDYTAAAKNRLDDTVVACTERHEVQIAGVGDLGPDGATDAAETKAYRDCDAMATGFLHEDWRNGRLEIRVVHGLTARDGDGSRWWECVLLAQDEFYIATTSTEDMSGGIPRSLRRGCQTTKQTGDQIFGVVAVDCAKPHNAEYAGAMVFPAGTQFPSNDRTWNVIHEGCRAVVAKFVGVSQNQVRNLYSSPMRDKKAWPELRDVRCYVYVYPKTMTKSAKGTHGKGVPW
ncbi:hypothetical protein Cs7R123_13010 [Catellatospora sp. TT07R-123]|uniref:septum formation family protein n=1 Tax=Catellatospora sp. TT07R-123 TaxID=2733863 RepID=UPI001B28A829|nr:septum formation family protein [Catellatospora sp. TT07R-123]GHJ43959.1 hypothetical protein Cs7R123_13010 [Catellatospora sp. TT07R-123]